MTIEESQAKGLWSRLRVLLGVRDSHHGLSEVDELGIRIPPARLRYDVAGTNDLEWFLEGGRLGLETLVSTLEKEKRHPMLGTRVVVGSNSTTVGAITRGDGDKIGSGSVNIYGCLL